MLTVHMINTEIAPHRGGMSVTCDVQLRRDGHMFGEPATIRGWLELEGDVLSWPTGAGSMDDHYDSLQAAYGVLYLELEHDVQRAMLTAARTELAELQAAE